MTLSHHNVIAPVWIHTPQAVNVARSREEKLDQRRLFFWTTGRETADHDRPKKSGRTDLIPRLSLANS